MLFGDKVRMLCNERNLTRMELCRMSGISKQNLGKIWNNKTTDPRAGTLIAIANALGVSPVELMQGVDFIKDED